MRPGQYWMLLEGDHCLGRSDCSFEQTEKPRDLVGSHRQRVGCVHNPPSPMGAESLAFREQVGTAETADLVPSAGGLQALVRG